MNGQLRLSGLTGASILAITLMPVACLATTSPMYAAVQCFSQTGFLIQFAEQPGISPPLEGDARCDDTFWCFQGEDLGPFIRLANPACDPTVGTCGIQLRFPLEFKGNKTNKAEHPNEDPPLPSVFWFAGAAPQSCQPWLDVNCGQIGICNAIRDDFVETFLTLGSASCDSPNPAKSGLFSIIAVTCGSRFSCPMREFASFTVSPQSVRTGLGCPDPPRQDCDSCLSCPLTGVPADGRGPRIGGEELGAGGGAHLYYAAGGAGSDARFPGTTQWRVALGRNWSHSYAMRLFTDPDETRVWLIEKTGTFREFRNPDGSGVYKTVSPSSEKRTLTWLGAGVGWELRELDGTVHAFDGDGLWHMTTDRNGNVTEGFYTGSQLDTVEFPDERREDFAYYPAGDPSEGKLHTITEVGVDNLTTRTWEYVWSGDDLVRVNRPDGTALEFFYGDASLPGYLTRIELVGDVPPAEETDPANRRVIRAYEYSAEGRVTKTWRGDASPTGPDAVDLWLLGLNDPDIPTVATVTPPVGDPITYTLGRDTGSTNVKVLSISGDCPTCGLGPNSQLSYGDGANPMLPTTIVDGRGTVTGLAYDAFGQVTSRTEADGEPGLQRTTFYTYDPTFPALLTSIEQPSVAGGAATRETVWTLDASGNVTQQEIFGVESGSALPSLPTVITPNAAGEPLRIDPPGFGTTDRTEFTYDPGRGNLVADSRTDPLVGTTTFGHDAFNRRTSVTDPDGIETTTSYDELDRVTEIRQVGASPPNDDLVTSHEYTVFGDLFRTTLPEGNVIEYGYDAAGRLISIEQRPDAATHGERVFYTLDAAGNRTLEKLQRWDADAMTPGWVTLSSTEYEYTNRCQVDRIIQAPDSAEEAVTEFAYDCKGNLEHQWDPNHDPAVDPPTSSYTYDALDRMTSVSQPWAGAGLATTSYGYDLQDHLVQVTDAEGNVTDYTYSDRDLLTYERVEAFVTAGSCSPAPACDPGCGCTAHAYNEHGALTTTTDARGVTVSRDVDELDRVLSVDYPDDALDTTYAYDSQPAVCSGVSFPLGRLASITRDGEAVEYCYDRFGRTTRDGELTYTWDDNGNRKQIVYPGGVEATYTHDFADREVTLEVTTPGGGAVAETVVQAASYFPSGPLSTLLLGSGTTESRAFDARYVPTAIGISGDPGGVGARTWSYTTDRVGNVLEIVERDVCPDAPLLLQNETVTTAIPPVTHCSSIEAGPAYTVDAGGDVTFDAGGRIVLKDGFSVLDGGRFVAISGTSTELSRRTFAYQEPQYFLTRADGPWGTLDWTYDKIGNRTSETRDGGSPDTYVYTSNGAGNTPVLDQVTLGIGGTRDYTWGAAGHLEEVAAGANVLDFGADAEGRLAGVTRTTAGDTAAFAYDGRSFLSRAEETAGGTSSVEPLYDSSGLVHALHRRPAPADPEELVVFFYLAGRPVSQVAIDGAGVETWTYLTTDHLGTPLLATGDASVITWEGGFEPFGRDYLDGTLSGALERDIHLRLPGQWDDTTWQDATSGAAVHYNVHRWYQPAVAYYSRPDPARASTQPYLYASQRPSALRDPLGLQASGPSTGTATIPGCCPPNEACCAEALVTGFFTAIRAGGITICCNGRKVPCSTLYSGLSQSNMAVQRLLIRCILEHELTHVRELPPCPPECGVTPAQFPTAQERNASECSASLTELSCLDRAHPGCAGNPACLDKLQQRRSDVFGQRREFGCSRP
jgi:RHS repeat-associated protein